MTSSVKTMGAAAGSLLLLSSAALAAAPAVLDVTADAATQAGIEQTVESGALASAVQEVQGQFSYDQGVVSSNETISTVFAKAAATLCDRMGEPAEGVIAQAVKVTCATGSCFEATVSDMADEEGAETYMMGCACSTNMAGGGAIVNADVSGISLATLMALAAA